MRICSPRRAVIIRAVLLVGVLAAPRFGHAQPAPAAAVPVTTATAVRRDIPTRLRALGTVQPFQTVTIRARVDGTLDKVLFQEGQSVKPGDMIAQLDPRPYQAVLDQALAKKAADEATLSSVRSDLVRYSDLANAQIASRQKLEQARAAVGQGEALIRGDEASIAAAQLNLGFTQIASPIEGRVGLRLLDPGNFIRAADAASTGIVTITQIHPIALLFTLPQDALQKVQAAMRRGTLPVFASSADGTAALSEGRLMTIDSAIDQSTGTIKLKAVFGNVDETLWPGQFVNVQLQTGIQTNVVTVPSAAVQRGQEGTYVYLLKPDQTVERRAVTVSNEDAGVSVVASGLDGVETVVVSGQSRLTNGSRVAAATQKPAS